MTFDSLCAGSRSGAADRLEGVRLWGILFFVTFLRAVVVFSPGALQTDPDSYRKVAGELAARGTFSLDGRPTAYRPPLYPLFLAGVILCCGEAWRWGIAGAHLLLGLGTVILAASIAKRLSGPHAAWPAALLAGLDPLLLHSSRLIMTETLGTFLAVLAVWIAVGTTFRSRIWRWFFLGVSLGACALTRPTFLLWPVGTGFVAAFLWRATRGRMVPPVDPQSIAMVARQTGRGRSAGDGGVLTKPVCIVAALAGMGVVLLPWVIRNIVVFERPIVGTTHGGYTFYLANNPAFYRFLRDPSGQLVWEANEFNRQWEEVVREVARGDELAADRLAYRRAWEAVTAQPTVFAYSCVYRAFQLWRPVPHQLDPAEGVLGRFLRWAVGAFYLAEYVLAALGTVRLLRNVRHSPNRSAAFCFLAWGGGLMLTLTAVHTFYWSNIRMRAPLIPVLAVCAALQVQTSIQSIPQTKWRGG